MAIKVIGKIIMRKCRKCNGEYSEGFFVGHDNSQRAGASYKDKVCIGCQQSARDKAKRHNRPREKARRTIRSHSDKYIKLGEVKTQDEFIDMFGWDIDQMAHDISHAFTNSCPYCLESFKDMGNGLADVTLDVIDSKELPWYKTNTKWVCGTCNNAKKTKSRQLWEERMRDYQKWNEQREKLNHNPYAGLPIFDSV
jgi:hypothetical protein